MKAVSQFVSKQWFPLMVLVAVVAGITVPSAAVLGFDGWTNTIVVLILFLGIGFTLPSESILAGIRQWRLHVAVQTTVFLVFPLGMTLGVSLFEFDPGVRIGLLALAVLPTTVSSCTVFTQTNGGNVVGTMFNAALANAVGVFLSPLLLSWLLRGGVGGLSPEEVRSVFVSLAWKMFLPIILGQIARYFFADQAKAWKKRIGKLSNLLIVLLVLLAVARSSETLVASLSTMAVPFVFLVGFHALTLLYLRPLGDVLGLPAADRVSLFFAGPQKTLALGVPLLTSYFSSRPELLGAALVPILFFHPMQLLTAGLISSSRLFNFWRTRS